MSSFSLRGSSWTSGSSVLAPLVPLLACVGDTGLSEYVDDSCSNDDVDPEYREWLREKVGVKGDRDARSEEDEPE